MSMKRMEGSADGNPKTESRRPKETRRPKAEEENADGWSGGAARLMRQARGLCAGGAMCLVLCLGLTGCFGFLKPARSTARHFVLTPIASEGSATQAPQNFGVGVGQVKVPAYLFDSSLAVRTTTNEIVYLASVLWAERLDNGIQRVLAANLATLLPSDLVRLSAWRSEDVAAEVYVHINKFDVDTAGHGEIAGYWRILAPGGEKILKAGSSQFTRNGPSPDSDPSGAVTTMSELVGDVSRQLAQAIKEATAK
jgi:uncharacterized lipoprotein YmbA